MVFQAMLLCLALVSSSPIAGGTVFTPEQTTLLQEFVETLMQCRGITGLTLAVVRGNETWTKGFGVADKESGRNVSSSTLFGIGSVTKAFTSAILSLFINETGRLVFCTYLLLLLPALPELLLLFLFFFFLFPLLLFFIFFLLFFFLLLLLFLRVFLFLLFSLACFRSLFPLPPFLLLLLLQNLCSRSFFTTTASSSSVCDVHMHHSEDWHF